MSFGIWSAARAGETNRQSNLVRHRILTVNCGSRTNISWNVMDASGMASVDPNSIAPDTHNTAAGSDRGAEGGPHFVMSGETSDGSPHSYGFEFALFTDGLPALDAAGPGAGGYTVTVWELISATQYPGGAGGTTAFTPVWISFQTQTLVAERAAYHSFDCNATCLRFQITNLADDPTTNSKSIGIAFVEL